MLADQLGPAEVQDLRAVLLAPEIVEREVAGLELAAHGAVQQHDAAPGEGEKVGHVEFRAAAAPRWAARSGGSPAAARPGSARRRASGSGPRRRGGGTARLATLAAIMPCIGEFSSTPSNSRSSQAGMPAPQPCEKRLICVKLWIGMMPGTYSAVDAGGDQPIAEAQDLVGVEAVLRHQPGGTRLDLAAQVVEVGLGALRPRDGPRDSSRR